MVARSKLPPEGVEFEIYRLVMIEMEQVETVAAGLKISTEQVRLLLARVTTFMIETAPGDDDQRPERLFVAERIAADRLNYLFGEALRCHRMSQGEQSIVREVVGSGTQVKTTRVCHGDGRFLLVATKIAEMAAKMPVGTLGEPRRAEASQETSENHPVGDCSAEAGEQGVTAKSAAVKNDASDSNKKTCESDGRSPSAPKVVQSKPVQPQQRESLVMSGKS